MGVSRERSTAGHVHESENLHLAADIEVMTVRLQGQGRENGVVQL
jgi:hypothetical protein